MIRLSKIVREDVSFITYFNVKNSDLKSQKSYREGVRKVPKKCDVFFERPLRAEAGEKIQQH
jgi:hypothetical protein